jgi:hypothetical protein
MATKIALTGVSTLGVTSDVPGAYKYQWMRNGVHVPGTQEKSLDVRNASAEDLKATYSVIVYGQGVSEESNKLVIGVVQPPPQPKDPAVPAAKPAAAAAQPQPARTVGSNQPAEGEKP